MENNKNDVISAIEDTLKEIDSLDEFDGKEENERGGEQ